ncbi:hypothetical protein BO71DRAFT_309626, partial [Aspergillus ellipticus CBS 707.79]
SSETSHIAYSQIMKNIATSDCFPYESYPTVDLPLRKQSYFSPLASVCDLHFHDEADIYASQGHSTHPKSQLSTQKAHVGFSTTNEVQTAFSCSPNVCDMQNCDTDTDCKYLSQTQRSRESQVISRKRPKVRQQDIKFPMNDNTSHPSSKVMSLSLGSLASFMQTRKRICRRQVPEQSPYFVQNEHPNNASTQGCDVAETSARLDDHTEELQSINSSNATQVPYNLSNACKQPELLLSTSLLKSHLGLVQCFERMEHLPSLVYKDRDIYPGGGLYGTQSKTTDSSLKDTEADIVIPPETGVILTNSQATTQLFLPGHAPEIASSIKSINSPLRERIFVLAGNYVHLYVLICHSSATNKAIQSAGILIDKHMLTSLTSFGAFCDSMASSSSIHPLLIMSSPEIIAEWVMALANK